VDHRAEAPPFGTRSVNRLDTRTRSTRILTCPGTWIQPSSLWCRRTTSRAGLPQPSATISRPPSARSRRWRWPIPRETPLLDRDRAESDDPIGHDGWGERSSPITTSPGRRRRRI